MNRQNDVSRLHLQVATSWEVTLEEVITSSSEKKKYSVVKDVLTPMEPQCKE